MPMTSERIEDEAIGWVLRLREASADDWRAFAAWLEADSAHAAAYDRFALLDRDLQSLAPIWPTPAPAPLHMRRIVGRRAVLGWSAAGAVAAAIIGYLTLAPRDTLFDVGTPAGQRRAVTLADGSRLDLNGGTRLVLDRANPRFARLEAGEALFTIVHDDTRPFRVEAGGTVIEDLGTVFNVAREGGVVEVAVAEGQVMFDPAGRAVRLAPGMTLRRDARGVTLGRADARMVGEWKQRRLSYSAARVSEIAEDLSRNIGVRVRPSPEIAARRFSGVIMLDGNDERVMERVATLLDANVRRSKDGWLLTPRGSPAL